MKKEGIAAWSCALCVIYALTAYKSAGIAAQNRQARGGRMVINEIMATAERADCDYVEVYNDGFRHRDLSAMRLGYRTTTGRLYTWAMSPEPYLLPPGGYAVLTRDGEGVCRQFAPLDASHVVEPPRMRTLASEATLIIYDELDAAEDSVSYSQSWHSPLLTDYANVALERISASGDSNSPANWTSAEASAGFATPGGPNSVSPDDRRPGGGLRLTKNSGLVAPNGGGLHAPERLEVRIESGSDVSGVSMSVYDADGRLAARPYNNVPMSAAEQTLTWDGRADDGSRLPPRTYIVVVEAWHANGRSESRKETITVTY